MFKDPPKNTLTMLKPYFLSASSLKLLDVTDLLRLRPFASKRPKMYDFPKCNGIFRRVPKFLFPKIAFIISLAILSASLFCMNFGLQENIQNSFVATHSSTMCTMSPIEHIIQWEQQFTAAQTLYDTKIILVALLIFAPLYLKNSDRAGVPIHIVKMHFYNMNDFLRRPFHHVLTSISDGILQPRIYA